MLETSKEYALLINFHDFELLGKCDQISVLLCVVGFFFLSCSPGVFKHVIKKHEYCILKNLNIFNALPSIQR